MKRCELCDSLAKVYCESDQANLCWDCDANVHSANFLVAKHSRSLLCHVCQSLTPWTGTGPKLGPTLSVCNSCVRNLSCREERRSEEDEEGDSDDDEDDDEDGDADEDDDEEEDGDEDEENVNGGNDIGGEDDEENQVVPWSSTPPPPVSSPSNNSEGCSSRFCDSGGGEPKSRRAFSKKHGRGTVP